MLLKIFFFIKNRENLWSISIFDTLNELIISELFELFRL